LNPPTKIAAKASSSFSRRPSASLATRHADRPTAHPASRSVCGTTRRQAAAGCGYQPLHQDERERFGRARRTGTVRWRRWRRLRAPHRARLLHGLRSHIASFLLVLGVRAARPRGSGAWTELNCLLGRSVGSALRIAWVYFFSLHEARTLLPASTGYGRGSRPAADADSRHVGPPYERRRLLAVLARGGPRPLPVLIPDLLQSARERIERPKRHWASRGRQLAQHRACCARPRY
jgi:hypothetical protein